MVLSRQCPMCGRLTQLEFTTEEVSKLTLWENRQLHIQDAFPDKPLNFRECIMTGFCYACQDIIFAEPEE